MRRAPLRLILTACGLALTLTACAAGQMGEQLPASIGGLPEGAPARPATSYQFPAVHDMPPPRDTKPMTEEEQVKAEKDLEAIRARQAGQEAQKPAAAAKKPAAKTPTGSSAKTQPADSKSGQNTGAKTSP